MSDQYIPYLAFLLMASVYILLIYVSRWPKMARFYRAKQPFTGKIHRMRNGAMGGVNFRGLDIGANNEGLLVSVIFRLGYPPLFIPWSNVTVVEEDTFMSGMIVVMSFSKVPGVYFKISRKLAERLKEDSNGRMTWKKA